MIVRSASRLQVMESRNPVLAAINPWYLKFNPKNTKSMVISWSRTIGPGYGEVPLSDAELEEVQGLHILRVTLDSNLTFETHLRKVESKAARRLGVVSRAGKLFDCPRVRNRCFNAYVLTSLEYCAPVWMSLGKSQLGLLDSIVRSAERLCEGELCCLGHRSLVFALWELSQTGQTYEWVPKLFYSSY